MNFEEALVLIVLIICVSHLIGLYMDYCERKSNNEYIRCIKELEKEIKELKEK